MLDIIFTTNNGGFHYQQLMWVEYDKFGLFCVVIYDRFPIKKPHLKVFQDDCMVRL